MVSTACAASARSPEGETRGFACRFITYLASEKTLAEISPGELPQLHLQRYSSSNQWLCLVDAARSVNGEPMTAIERTTYPRFKRILSAKDLEEVYTPTPQGRFLALRVISAMPQAPTPVSRGPSCTVESKTIE